MRIPTIRRALMAMVTAIGVTAVAGIIWSQTRHADAATQDNTRALFVQSVASGTFDGEALRLVNASGLTLWFSNRPDHRAGYVKDADFNARWASDSDSFADDPPNAVLYLASDGSEAVVELLAFDLSGDSLVYKVRTVSGTVPASFGGAALFIDDGRIPDYQGMGTSVDNLINALGH